jgi:hypothetical protein
MDFAGNPRVLDSVVSVGCGAARGVATTSQAAPRVGGCGERESTLVAGVVPPESRAEAQVNPCFVR